jgi:uncharacterized membrane protein YfcA
MFELALTDILLLIPTAIVAGAVNSIAGGGTFFSFPILILLGMPPLTANTTNKVGIAIASVAGVAGFRQELKIIRHHLLFYILLGTLGSVVGSYLLLTILAEQFSELVPWLMLAATCLFKFSSRLLKMLRPRNEHDKLTGVRRWVVGAGQFAIGVYGGFFAAGMGILMLALYELAGMKNIHEMNAVKVVVALAINVISAGVFLLSGTVNWAVAGILIVGAMIGGYYGAVFSKKISPAILRNIIVLYGAGMTVYLFVR